MLFRRGVIIHTLIFIDRNPGSARSHDQGWRQDCKLRALTARNLPLEPALPPPGFPQPSPGHLGQGHFLWGPPSCAHKGMQSTLPSGCQWHCSSVTTEMAPEARSAGGSPQGPWFACSSFPLLLAPALLGECILPPPHAPGFEHVTCFGHGTLAELTRCQL